jgi:predicted transcriptional regulator
MLRSVQVVLYRDKKVVGVFVRFSTPLKKVIGNVSITKIGLMKDLTILKQ